MKSFRPGGRILPFVDRTNWKISISKSVKPKSRFFDPKLREETARHENEAIAFDEKLLSGGHGPSDPAQWIIYWKYIITSIHNFMSCSCTASIRLKYSMNF